MSSEFNDLYSIQHGSGYPPYCVYKYYTDHTPGNNTIQQCSLASENDFVQNTLESLHAME